MSDKNFDNFMRIIVVIMIIGSAIVTVNSGINLYNRFTQTDLVVDEAVE